MEENIDYVVCQICHKQMKHITNTHLKYHGITKEEYETKYPSHKLICENIISNNKKSGKCNNNKECGAIRKQKAEALYNKKPKLCLYCNKIIPYDKRFNKFCDHSCSVNFTNKKYEIIYNDIGYKEILYIRPKLNKCIGCGEDCYKKYCSVQCQQTLKCNEKLQKWKNGELTIEEILNPNGQLKPLFRNYIMEKCNHKCELCGWDKKNPVTNRTPLEVDHIDGDSKNNKEENLRLVCPNCHSLTPTYKSLNKGKGRNQRMKRYNEGKSF